jgi:hypothetical protein
MRSCFHRLTRSRHPRLAGAFFGAGDQRRPGTDGGQRNCGCVLPPNFLPPRSGSQLAGAFRLAGTLFTG